MRDKTARLINSDRSCFTTNIRKLGKCKSTKMCNENRKSMLGVCVSTRQDRNSLPYRIYLAQKREEDDSCQSQKGIVCRYKSFQMSQSCINVLPPISLASPSTSSFSSHILLVKKKDGKCHMCVDYKLNNAAIKDKLPLTPTDDQIDKLL